MPMDKQIMLFGMIAIVLLSLLYASYNLNLPTGLAVDGGQSRYDQLKACVANGQPLNACRLALGVSTQEEFDAGGNRAVGAGDADGRAIAGDDLSLSLQPEMVINPVAVFAQGTAENVVVVEDSITLTRDAQGDYVRTGTFTSPVYERIEATALGSVTLDADIPVHNLLTNPGFEQGTSGWTLTGAPSERFTIQNNNAKEGASSLVIDVRGDLDSGALHRVNQKITIEPNTYYQASMDFKFSALSKELTLYYRLITTDPSKSSRHHPDSQNHFESADWKTVTTLFKTTDLENGLEIEPAVQPDPGNPTQISLDNMAVTRIDYAKLQVKTSSDGAQWGDWSDAMIRGKTSIILPPGRYFQYRILLNTDNPAKAPKVKKITFSTCGNFQQDRGETKENCRSDFRPFLLFEKEDIPALRSKLENIRPPDNRWLATDWKSGDEVNQFRTHTFQKGVVDLLRLHKEYSDDNYARGLAFSYIMTGDSSFAQKAKEGLFYDDISLEYNYHVNMFLGGLALNTAQAYDWIINEQSIPAEEKAKMQEFLGKLAYKLYVLNRRGVGRVESRGVANPRFVGLSGLGMVALALPGYEHPVYGSSEEWLELAYQELFGTFTSDAGWLQGVQEKNSVDLEFSDEGYYLEGPAYLGDSVKPLFQFMAAYEKVKGVNLFRTTKIQNVVDYGIKTALPSRTGFLPNNNDATYTTIPFPTLAAKFLPEKAPHYYWYNYVRTNGGFGDKIVNFLFYDPSIQAQEPPWKPSQYFADTGNIIFKTDWSDQSKWFYILGKTRTPGHAQEDQTGFSLWSHGQYLLPELGYSPGNLWIADAEAQNLILADGEGPFEMQSLVTVPDATVVDYFFDEQFMKGANIRINYLNRKGEKPYTYTLSDVRIERNFVFPFDEYFVVFDKVEADKPHSYENLLHFGNRNNGEGTLAIQDKLLDWQTIENAQLLAHVNAPNVQITQHRGIGNWKTKDTFDIPYTKARTQGEDVTYITFLYPKWQNENNPRFEDVSANGVVATKMTKQDRVVIAGTQATAGEKTIAGLMTDAQSFLLDTRGNSKSFFLRKGSLLTQGNDRFFWSSRQAAAVAFQIDGNHISGYLDAPEGTTLRIYGSGIATVSINGQQVPFTQKEGYVEILER